MITPIAAATVLRRNRLGTIFHSGLRQRLEGAHRLGRALNPPLDDSDTNRLHRSRYLNLYENSERDTPNTSPPYCNTLSSTLGKQTCGSHSGNGKSLRPAPSTGRNKKNPWNGQEAGADNKEERYNGDGDKKTTHPLGSAKKRCPSAAEGTSASNCRVKRHRWLSPKRDKAVGRQGGCGMLHC